MKYPLLILLTFCFCQTKAQSSIFYLPIGFGMSHYQAKDEYNSPLRYRGWVSNLHLGHEQYGRNFLQQSNYAYHFGGIQNGARNKNIMALTRGSGTAHVLYNFRSERNFDYFIGTTLKIQFSTRSSGKLLNFDGAATVSLTVGATYNNPINDGTGRWFYDGTASLPLIGWGIRPRYASLAYIGEISNFKAPSQIFLLFPKHFDIDARFNANWDMGNGNLLRGSYRWWFYDSKYIHRVRAMENGFDFSLLTRLN